MYKLFASYRPASLSDLDGINKLIELAVMNWPMPTRLKRRAVAVLQYDAVDLAHFTVFVCIRNDEILGVAALDLHHSPEQGLLHGLFVLPIIQGHGIGKQLMQMAFDLAAEDHLVSVLIKAESVAAPYFHRLGLEPIDRLGPNDYPHQFKKTLNVRNRKFRDRIGGTG
ncbi:MAG: N-acetylglutamate synthase-like GNAT family acetyltransferase [Planctomycetaceae bacterium]|jgi:N-acetylglutamate synthase-like GNAT family acetyltransferase